MPTYELRNGYDNRSKNPTVKTFRAMTPDEAKTVNGQMYFTGDFRTYRLCRTNGRAKTWKTRSDVELPIKYGMYECARAVSHFDPDHDGEMRLPNGGILLVEIESQEGEGV